MFRKLLFGLIVAGGIALPLRAEEIVVRPADNGAALLNPGMGWTMHFYSNITKNYGSRLEPSDTLDSFPGCSVVYLRLPWSHIEPEEGEFNWAILDTPAQRWITAGKQVAFRFTCCESWTRWATPEWVHKAGAQGVDFEFGKGPRDDGPLWAPKYDDPVFLAKLDRFLAAAAKRYNGNPDVSFIDVGTFGMWGEGHTGFDCRLSQEETDRMTKIHIDLHKKHFDKTLLCISDDVAGASRPGESFPATDYAFSQGVTLRDDSILVQKSPSHWFHGQMAQKFWPTLPVILEHEHYGGSKARGAWDDNLLVQSVEEYHASYMSIHWWPEELLAECRETIDKINRRLGYRLQLRELRYPGKVSIGEAFDVSWSWVNAGVAPCYPGGFAALTLKDDRGGIVSVLVEESLNMETLLVGSADQPVERSTTGRFRIGLIAPATKPGVYDLYVSVGRRDGTPRFALPLDGNDGARRYKIGRIELKNAE